MKYFLFTLATLFAISLSQAQRSSDELVLYTFHEESNQILNLRDFSNPILVLENENNALFENNSMSLSNSNVAMSFQPATTLNQAIINTQAFTVEAWIKPANNTQNGPARIITLSNGTSDRNLTLAQDGDKYILRTRTSNTTSNGMPNFDAPNGSVTAGQLQHLVATRDAAGNEKMYINGELVAEQLRTGNLNNWNPNYKLALGNEIGADRPWLGAFHLVALYDQALTQAEVLANYNAGASIPQNDISNELCAQEDCFVNGFGQDQRVIWFPSLPNNVFPRFAFDENGGTFDVFDDGTAHLYGNCTNMQNPDYGLYIDVWFKNRMDWNEWSALGRSWKGNANIVGNLYETWDYYIMDPDKNNRLIGTGNYDGDVLQLTHRPANYEYGFQVGLAANDQNAENGMSIWFDYTGTLEGAPVADHGDINLEGDCIETPIMACPIDLELECTDGDFTPALSEYPVLLCDDAYELSYSDEVLTEGCPLEILRTWTASLNGVVAATCTQSISVLDGEAPVFESLDASITLNCGEEFNPQFPQVSDNCSVLDTSTNIVELNPDDFCQYRTQTPGGWGSPANGNNPGTYRDAHFDEVFPNGLSIGCNNSLTLTSASAVEAFLPSGGQPAVLPNGQMTDPSNYNNTLASHLVSLKLSIAFDQADPNFGASLLALGDLEVSSGAFVGFTVSEIITIADQVIGGCSSLYTASQLTGILSSINENFVDGDQNNGFFDCEADFCDASSLVIYTATDGCGNVSSTSQIVVFLDDEAPSFINAESDVYVSCGELDTVTVEAIDNCDSEVALEIIEELNFSGACLPTIQRTYQATDDCGNVSTFVQFIHQTDTIAPVFVAFPEDLSLNCGEEIPVFETVANDNCSDVLLSFSESMSGDNCNQVLIQTWTAMDACGNTSSISRSVVFVDDEAPTGINFESEISISCSEWPLEEASFADNCSSNVQVELTETMLGDACNQTITRSYEVSDDCGNTAVFEQTISILDDEAPVFSFVPSDETQFCQNLELTVEPVVTDNCQQVQIDYFITEIPSANGCYALQRTWVTSDLCGNVSEASQIITVIDNAPPVFFGIPEGGNVSCEEINAPIEVNAVDQCSGEVEVIVSFDDVLEACVFTRTYVFTAEDACGNVAQETVVLSYNDSQAPIISAPEEITLNCGAEQEQFGINATDDCVFTLDLSFTDEVLESNDCGQNILRTWTATDACGNTSSTSQLIHFVDDAAPVFTSFPADLSVSCSSTIPTETPVAMDACGEVILELEETIEGDVCNQIITRTWTASDACGNSSTQTQIIMVSDTEAPVFVTLPEDLLLNCGDAIPAIEFPGLSDNCDLNPSVTVEENTTSLGCEASFVITRTFTASDACGNVATHIQVIEVIDNTPPVFDQSVSELNVSCGNIPEPEMLTASDDCSAVNITYSEETLSGGCPNILRVWTATDACGNTTVLTQQVNVSDTESPVLTGIPPNTTATCSSIPEMPEPEVSDNCDQEVAVTVNESIVGAGCEFTIVRTWIASDDCGNTTIVSQSILVSDESAPVFVNAPSNMTVECSALDGLPLPNVVDDCAATVVITFEDQFAGGGCTYDILRTYTATDACGNTVEAVMTITVVDTTPPVISGVPANTFVTCDNIPDPAQVSVIDACGGATSLEIIDNTIGQGCSYIINRNYLASDECGNSTSMTQLIFVQDDSSPVFEGGTAYTHIDCNEAWPIIAPPTASDNCSETTFSQFTIEESNDCSTVRTTTFTASDACGNMSTFVQVVEQSDLDGPVFTMTLTDLNVSCEQIPAAASLSATDNCSSATVTVEEEVFPGNCPYEIRRTYRATDLCGNSTVQVQSIFVSDNMPPSFVSELPQDLTVSCEEVPTAAVLEASDDCGSVSVVMEESFASIGCTSLLSRRWTATDQCGNQVQHEQNITIVDETAPVFSNAPEDLVVNCLMVPEANLLAASDNCSDVEVSLEITTTEGDCPSEYEELRIWTATDACGNTTQHAQLITVIDDIAPILIGVPDDIMVECDEVPAIPEVTALESCGESVEVVFEEIFEDVLGDESCTMENAVNSFESIALWLPGIEGVGANYIFTSNGGSISTDPETGNKHLTGEVFNTQNANQRWMIDILLTDERNWEEWSANGGDYKDDANVAGDHYLDWNFYVLNAEASVLIGMGDFEGSTLSLTHMPANLLYGFQLGQAANNRNDEFGMSGWFFYSGNINGVEVNGPGDVIVELDCCQDQRIVRTWTATDCAGNTTSVSQIIEVVNQIHFDPNSMIYPSEPAAFEVSGTEGAEFILNFLSPDNGAVSLTVMNANGQVVESFSGIQVLKDGQYQWRIPKGSLSKGSYYFNLRLNEYQFSDRELKLN